MTQSLVRSSSGSTADVGSVGGITEDGSGCEGVTSGAAAGDDGGVVAGVGALQPAAKLNAKALQYAPGALKLTPDQVDLLRSDNVVSEAAKAAGLTLEGLGIAPDSLEGIAPGYLWRFRKTGQFRNSVA